MSQNSEIGRNRDVPDSARQKPLLFISVIMNAAIGFLTYPLLSRMMTDHELAVATMLLFINAFYGVCDILRPVYVQHFSSHSKQIAYSTLLIPSLLIGVPTAIVLFVFLTFAYSSYFTYLESIYIGISLIAFLLYSSFWSVLEYKMRIGDAYFIKSLGTSSLYIIYIMTAYKYVSISFVNSFILVHFILLVAFYVLAKKYVNKSEYSADREFWQNARSTIRQNIGKLVVDFMDRFFFAKFAPLSQVAIYNMFYEITSKVNIVPQNISAYAYPRMCINSEEEMRYGNLTIVYSFLVSVFGIVILFFGDYILSFYLGRDAKQLTPLFSAMLAIFSHYGISFFTQASLRARNEFRLLSNLVLAPALIGALVMYPVYVWFDVFGLLAIVFFMRSGGVFGLLLDSRPGLVKQRIAAVGLTVLNATILALSAGM